MQNIDSIKNPFMFKFERGTKTILKISKILFLTTILFIPMWLYFGDPRFFFAMALSFVFSACLGLVYYTEISTLDYAKNKDMDDQQFFDLIRQQYNEMYGK